MNRIVFSELWDKLRVGEPRFTTIRSYTRQKERYYRSLIGQTLVIWYSHGGSDNHGRELGTAVLRDVSAVVPRDMPVETLREDVLRSGKVDSTWMKRLCAMDVALLLKFEKEETRR